MKAEGFQIIEAERMSYMRRREPEKCEWEPVTLPFPISGPVSSTSSLIRARLCPEPEERETENSQGLR